MKLQLAYDQQGKQVALPECVQRATYSFSELITRAPLAAMPGQQTAELEVPAEYPHVQVTNVCERFYIDLQATELL